MKFVIDPRCFDGCCVTSMSDGVHNDYGDNETLEELRTRENNPFLITVSGNTIRKMTRIHERGLCAPFREITEDEYYDKLDILPPVRHTRHFFFIGEPYSGNIYPFCFNMGGRCFTGLRSVRTPRKELERQMAVHYADITFRPAIRKEKSSVIYSGETEILITPDLFINRSGEERFICNVCSNPKDKRNTELARKYMAGILRSLRKHHFLYFSDYDEKDDMDLFLDRVKKMIIALNQYQC